MMSQGKQIVPGISVTEMGQASVDPSLTDALFDLAIQLEESTGLPVDIEHVVAALVLAARAGALDPATKLASNDPTMTVVLEVHVKAVFTKYGNSVGLDDIANH